MTTLTKQLIFIALALTLAGCDKVTVSTVTSLLAPAEKIQVASPEGSDFQVNGCNLTYKGQSLIFDASIDEWVKILGPYDRVTHLANDVYYWDEIGIGLYSKTNKHTALSLMKPLLLVKIILEPHMVNAYAKQKEKRMNLALKRHLLKRFGLMGLQLKATGI